MTDRERPHAKNVSGPFYVVDGCCTACGVPEATAPGMFAYDSAMHCYVTQQPDSEDEVERALQVIRGQELGCVRYRGVDHVILRRLAEAGESSSCDFPLKGVEPILRNVVTFIVNGTETVSLDEFLDDMRGRLPSIEIRTRNRAGSSLSFSWYEDNYYELILRPLGDQVRRWMISHNGPLGVSEWLHRWLSDTSRVESVRWLTESDLRRGDPGQECPW